MAHVHDKGRKSKLSLLRPKKAFCQKSSRRRSLRRGQFSGSRFFSLPENAQALAGIVSGLQKGPAERGHVKKRQKSSKSVKDTFRHFSRRAKNVKNRQKASKSFSTLFDNFRAATFFRPLLGGSEIAFRAAGKSVKNFSSSVEICRKTFQQGISGSHSLLEFSDFGMSFLIHNPKKLMWVSFLNLAFIPGIEAHHLLLDTKGVSGPNIYVQGKPFI